MSTTTTLTVRISLKTREKLDRIAEITQRSKSFLAARALEAYATRELEVCEKILKGLEDVKAGRVVGQDEVERKTQAIIDAAFARQKRA